MSGHIIPKDAPQISVPERLTKPHPLVTKLKEAAKPLPKNQWGWTIPRQGIHPLEVSREQLPRALRIIQALISECLARGYEVRESAQNQKGLSDLLICFPDETIAVRIKAKDDVLTLTLPNVYSGQHNWSDGKLAPLERKLGMVIQEMEHRAEIAHERAEARRREEEEEERRRVRAVAEAKRDFHEDQLSEELRRQIKAWRLATDIRAFVGAARQRGLREEETEWLHRAVGFADAIDPLGTVLTMPEFEEPTSADLRPYLGWDPWRYLD